MYCKECLSDWGIADQRGENRYLLKLQSFKMMNLRTEKKNSYKKWLDVSYEIPEIGADERQKET
ncbi:hypothetical protein DPMN_180954 [Dreissena polymorpha]|uniref:RLR CTR domain-containing protein n=1 Tax=Dreissena polymorpha TaxID=45954 RepID=A0A9D4I147_DREPO|nr:hypothetical protein DPMN_180954 [Dreissena polymorpha]